MYQFRFISCNKITLWVGDVGIGGSYAYVEGICIAFSMLLYRSFSITVNLKLLLEKKKPKK
jgi:hypothetical protein